MPNIIACIHSVLDKLAQSSGASEIDWQELEETKERLARMRFKQNRADYSWSGPGENLFCPNRDLADTKFGSAFRRARFDAARRWLHNSDQTDIASNPSSGLFDKSPSIFEPQCESFAPPTSFDPLIIPGVVFDANPDSFDQH